MATVFYRLKTLKTKSAARLIINDSTSDIKYVFVNHYECTIARATLKDEKITSFELYSSAPSTTDFRAINESFIGKLEIKKIKGKVKVKMQGEDEWKDVSINTYLDWFDI